MFRSMPRVLVCLLTTIAVAGVAACGADESGTRSQTSVQVTGQSTESHLDVATTQTDAASSLLGRSPEIWDEVYLPATGLTYKEAQEVRRILGVQPDGGYRTGISDALMQGNRHLHVEGDPSVLESVKAELLALNMTVSTLATDGSPVTTAIAPPSST